MNPLFTHFSDEASGPAALGISGQAFVIQLLTFLVVFLILKKWAFGPIIKLLNNRREVIENGVTLGEKMRAEEAKLEDMVAQKLHETRRAADKLLADADTEAKQKIQAAEDMARKRADGIIKDAAEQTKHAVERERKKLEQEAISLVSEVSEAVIGEKVDAKKDAAIIDKALQKRKVA